MESVTAVDAEVVVVVVSVVVPAFVVAVPETAPPLGLGSSSGFDGGTSSRRSRFSGFVKVNVLFQRQIS